MFPGFQHNNSREETMREASREDRERLFWDRYLQTLHSQGVTPPFDRWHVLRAEQFIRGISGRHLADIGAGEVSAYLEEAGRNGDLKAWQYRQLVVAIRILFSMVKPGWLPTFDWDFWLGSSRPLEPQHASVARQVGRAGAQTEAVLAERVGDKGCARVVHCYPEVFAKLSGVLRTRGMSIRTEKSYMHWLCRFIAFNDGRAPAELGAVQVVSFLQHLAVERNVAASTQNQALNALVFFYDKTLEQPLGDLGPFIRAKRPRHLPAVLSTAEVKRLLAGMDGVYGLIAALLYGTGMRLLECLRLRVQDVEFERNLIMVRRG
jgi:hypothetical protein